MPFKYMNGFIFPVYLVYMNRASFKYSNCTLVSNIPTARPYQLSFEVTNPHPPGGGGGLLINRIAFFRYV